MNISGTSESTAVFSAWLLNSPIFFQPFLYIGGCSLHPGLQTSHVCMLHCSPEQASFDHHKLKNTSNGQNSVDSGWNNSKGISATFKAFPLEWVSSLERLLVHAKRHCKHFFLPLKINVQFHSRGYLKRRIKPITFFIFLILFQVTGQREREAHRGHATFGTM